MSNKHSKTDLEKEFELERLILFSDAVFAIAITLLVIDLKFPKLPEIITLHNLLVAFTPTFYEFLGLAVSFTFIGGTWYNHLKLFRHLKKYDQGLINRNLSFLFFIVIFPFTAAGVAKGIEASAEGANPIGILFSMYFYTINIAFVAFFHWQLCRYIFYKRPTLTTEEEAAVKTYIYIKAKYNFLSVFIALMLATILAFLTPNNGRLLIIAIYMLPVITLFFQWRMKKYKRAAEAAH